MLHIIDDYYAKGDTLGYTVAKRKESKKLERYSILLWGTVQALWNA